MVAYVDDGTKNTLHTVKIKNCEGFLVTHFASHREAIKASK